MKKTITTALTATLMAGSFLAAVQPALAQNPWQQRQGQAQAQPQPQPVPQARPQPQPMPQPRPQPQPQQARPQQVQPQDRGFGRAPQQNGGSYGRRDQGQGQGQGPGDPRQYRGQPPQQQQQQQFPNRGAPPRQQQQGGSQFQGRPGGGRQLQTLQPNRGNRDYGRPRYDPRRYPQEIRATRRYEWRGPYYRNPPGFYIRTWQYGDFLPFAWFTPDFYIDDWSFYGLEYPPIGYEWVREGRDAVLVDIYTGEIVQIVYGLFY